MQLANSTGSVTDSYLYDSFGNILLTSGTTVNQFRYVGRLGYYYGVDTNDFYIRARVYNPGLGRFLSQDPLAIGVGSFRSGLYIYVISNPVNLMDASGLDAASDALCRWGQRYTCVSMCGAAACAWGSLLSENSRISGDIGSGKPRLPGNENDAIRHCDWQCQIAKSVGPAARHASVMFMRYVQMI